MDALCTSDKYRSTVLHPSRQTKINKNFPFLGDPKTRRLRRPEGELQPRLERLQEWFRRSCQRILAGQREHLHAHQQRGVHPEGGTRGFRRK